MAERNHDSARRPPSVKQTFVAVGNGSIAVADLLSENVLTYFRLVFFSR